jgi:hypothetical protein
VRITKGKNGVRAKWKEVTSFDVTFPEPTWKYLQDLKKKKDWHRILIWCFQNENLEPKVIFRILNYKFPKQ